MYTLNVILRKNSPKQTIDLLVDAANRKNIKVNKIFSDEFDFSKKIVLWKSDLLYRIWTDKKSILLEKIIINDEVKSFYHNINFCLWKYDNVIEWTIVHEKNNLPIIKTIYTLSSNKEVLTEYSKVLNWFPIVLKSTWGSHWVWVIKVDSIDSLNSVADYMIAMWDEVILREYIDYKKHLRVIVLWDQVVWSVEYKKVKWDFRSNVWEKLDVVKCELTEEIADISIKSVNTLWLYFWWVDILIDQNDNPYIAEVNTPCFFPRTQEVSGKDIAWKMLEFLIQL